MICAANGHGKVGIATSKKIGEKPPRNLLKRRIREAIRAVPHLVREDLNYVVIASVSASRISYAELALQTKELFELANDRWEKDSASS